jgi:hypothetical protein
MKYILFSLFLGGLFFSNNLFAQTTPVCELPTNVKNIVKYPIDKNQELAPPVLFGPNNPPPLGSENRLIYWVHGLGAEDGGAWARASAATDNGHGATFPARRTVGFRIDYTETGIEPAANELRNEMVVKAAAFPTLNPFRNIAIAHSQGGIVSREIDRQYAAQPSDSRSFGGIVTFCSPHLGARILNNKLLVQEAMGDACAAFTIPIVLNTLDKPILNIFLNEAEIQAGINATCDNVGNFIPLFVKTFNRGTTNDIYVGAPKINELNAQNTWALEHKLGLYGVEYAADEDSHNPKGLIYRTMSSFSLENPENQPAFTTDNDGALLAKVNDQIFKYQVEAFSKQLDMFILEAQGFPCDTWWKWVFQPGPLDCAIFNPIYNAKKTQRDAYLKAANFLLNLDETYKTLIGAVEYQTLPTCVCTKLDPDGDEFSLPIPTVANPIDCAAYPANTSWDNCIWSTAVQLVRKESDGVVLAESAMAFPGANDYLRLEKSNHFQVRNDSNTKKGLLWVYKSGASDGSNNLFFATLKK